MAPSASDHETFVQQFDEVPGFWQFLEGLRSGDLIAELVQNDLDAGAGITRIAFLEDRFVCEGDGQPVDEDGWVRLSFLKGAGDRAPRKRNRIGVKNHGLKACFTIGDEILIRSSGRLTKQTLYADGRDSPPSPGAYKQPKIDSEAPAVGCRIEVPYRVSVLAVNVGEPFMLDAPSPPLLETLFRAACAEAPRRFIAALRPDLRKNYQLVLEHHALGKASFRYRCTRSREVHGLVRYSRSCVAETVSLELSRDHRESCALLESPELEGSQREIPDFYSAPRGVFAEVAWRTDQRGKPRASSGRRRYPIEYAGDGSAVRTGIGVHFSGPYISDVERHGATDSSFNGSVDAACSSLFLKLLRQELIPRHGAAALALLVDSDGGDGEATKRLLAELLHSKGIPVVRSNKARQARKGSERRSTQEFGPKSNPLLIPVLSWEQDRVFEPLAEICPEGDQVDPKTPGPIIQLLASGELEGWRKNHVTFDESDAVDRFVLNENAYFSWREKSEWQTQLGNPVISIRYLDVLRAALDARKLSEEKTQLLPEQACLPDSDRRATLWSNLCRGLELPRALRTAQLPPVLHPQVADHPLLRRNSWRPRKFGLREFIHAAHVEEADERFRHTFWTWLVKNWRAVPKGDWARLADLSIWPDQHGMLAVLSDLCSPRVAGAGQILEEFIRRPADEVTNLAPVRRARRGKLYIRSDPNEQEIADYWEKRSLNFTGGPLSEDQCNAFRRLEAELEELASWRVVAGHLRILSESALRLSRGATVMQPAELLEDSEPIRALRLPERFLLDKSHRHLDSVPGWSPARRPTTVQILDALREDPERVDALPARLQSYLSGVKREGNQDAASDITAIACIPLDRKFFAPAQLAFRNPRGDYWSDWKTRLPGTGLSAEVQQLYRRVGVASGDPDPPSSLKFFRWLSDERGDELGRYLACIIRHIRHRSSVQRWWGDNPTTPCIPVESAGRVALVSVRDATTQARRIFLPDFEALADAIREENSNLNLAIVRHQHVREPITEILRDVGVQSLRERAGEPISVCAHGESASAPHLVQHLEHLRTRRLAQELRKRLDDLELSTSRLRHNWQSRLADIRDVVIAERVDARYQLYRQRFTVSVSSAFNPTDGCLWICADEDQAEDRFYEIIATRIFEAPLKFYALVLKESLRREYREDPSRTAEPIGDESEDSGEFEVEDQGLEEVSTTHERDASVPRRNFPRPGPIPTAPAGTSRARLRIVEGPKSRETGVRPRDPLEEEQIAELKANQYAWHCQVCLAARMPDELAPPGSYTASPENRQMLMEAHHVDQAHARGMRSAANLLLLCHQHHTQLGDCLSRALVLNALRQRSAQHTVSFQRPADSPLELDGLIVSINVPTRTEIVRCFFTTQHAEFWIDLGKKS